MDINLIVNSIFEYGSFLLAVMAVLVFVTNIIVEVIKGLVPKIPTNIVALVIALIVTVVALLILCSVLEITVMWYYAVGAVVLGIFVGYAAMFGFDKFKAAWEKLKEYKR
jgi:Na+-translocating ferredoxin:NAD+ oxidoreductase RnfE subunit